MQTPARPPAKAVRSPRRLATICLSVSALAVTLLAIVSRCGPLWYGGSPFVGRVIDTTNGRPVPAAIVVVVWQWAPVKIEGHESSRAEDIFAVFEAVTDREGSFRVPGWRGRRRPFLRYLPYEAPHILVVKRGYQATGTPNNGDRLWDPYGTKSYLSRPRRFWLNNGIWLEPNPNPTPEDEKALYDNLSHTLSEIPHAEQTCPRATALAAEIRARLDDVDRLGNREAGIR